MLSKSKIKLIQSLKLKKYRQKYNLFIAEGDKIVQTLLQQNRYQIEDIIGTEDWLAQNPEINTHSALLTAPKESLRQLTNLKSNPDVVAIVKLPQEAIIDFKTLRSAIYLDDVQDPGNVGTIIRIADWYGIQAVIRSVDSADFYNPKVVQSTMGSFANVSLSTLSREELIAQKAEMNLICSHLNGEKMNLITPPAQPLIIMGNEGNGVSAALIKESAIGVFIPGATGRIADSLNVSVATALMAHHFIKL